MNKRILLCQFHQESNTFNPMTLHMETFLKTATVSKGETLYHGSQLTRCAYHGMIKTIEANGDTVVPGFSYFASSGGCIGDDVLATVLNDMREAVSTAGPLDAVCLSLHGATCSESEPDVCGAILEFLRSLVGEDIPVTASFDLHANITERILRNADAVSGYQTYPHCDQYETGCRAAAHCLHLLEQKPLYTAYASIPMLTPPSGYTTSDMPFRGVIDCGHEAVRQGLINDFTVFNVQPWLDIPRIASTVVALGEDPEQAQAQADRMAQLLFDAREGCWPDLMSIDEVIDHAESSASKKPVILVDASDSPNGGAVGDSVVTAQRLLERGSKLQAGLFVKDAEAVKQAFAAGVGGKATFTLGNKISKGLPAPLEATGTVRSLHDGIFRREDPVAKGIRCYMGKTAVVSFGSVDIILCETPTASGDPQLFRHFGIEPTLYDLIVVKANTSFRAPYSKFAGDICVADTPGAGASNLHLFQWENLPKGMYPFDLPEGYTPAKATVWQHRKPC